MLTILVATVICAPLNPWIWWCKNQLFLQQHSHLQEITKNENSRSNCSFPSTHIFPRISLVNIFHVRPVYVKCDHDTKTNTAGIYIHFMSPLNWKAYLLSSFVWPFLPTHSVAYWGGGVFKPEILKISVESSIAWARRTGVSISFCSSLCSHTVVIYQIKVSFNTNCLAVAYLVSEFKPTRHPESLTKSNRIANWAENV